MIDCVRVGGFAVKNFDHKCIYDNCPRPVDNVRIITIFVENYEILGDSQKTHKSRLLYNTQRCQPSNLEESQDRAVVRDKLS